MVALDQFGQAVKPEVQLLGVHLPQLGRLAVEVLG